MPAFQASDESSILSARTKDRRDHTGSLFSLVFSWFPYVYIYSVKWYNNIMTQSQNFEFTPTIQPTEENAKAIQALTLQDVIAGGFENPTSLANPDDPAKVDTQIRRLTQYPERYSGYQDQNETIVAYIKQNEWLAHDESPFVTNSFARKALKARMLLKVHSLNPKAYGVFGLVASDELETSDQEKILEDLFVRSIGNAATQSYAVINIVLHAHDPATSIAQRLGFKSTDPEGEASGAPGLAQKRYQLSLNQTTES